MMNEETLQWAVDNEVKLQFKKLQDRFCLIVIVQDPCGNEPYYTAFWPDDTNLSQQINSSITALREAVDGPSTDLIDEMIQNLEEQVHG
ncbi:hypothetical protein LCGC14_1133940 [marine sediment metagenome]|uniref:Uncharacterized protein n=1 Tax=marine sediment metagenome TaxID=412755 RepID=A0A0F9M585_9ZZZZ